MSLSSEAKKLLRAELQQQRLKQEVAKYNEAKRLFTGLTDLDYKPSHGKHTYYKYWLASNSYTDRNDTALLEAYKPEELYSQYIIRMARKGYTVIDHPIEVYGILDAHKCIDGNQPLRLIIDIDTRQKPDPTNAKLPSLDSEKITREDLLSRILVACADALSLIPGCMLSLNSFALASSSNADKCSWHIIYPRARFVDYRELKDFIEKVMELVGEPYSKFIDTSLPKKHFNLRLLESAKEGRIKRPVISSVKKELQKLEDYIRKLFEA
ncbi:hypothetical protein Glove_406g22 [Diversispora epigaea]|uniref:Uncharacterized protein n=1 Tax=Diversispora epigaea TaxID=1348612 RepID=A0A397H0C2_9GLOM|nr:hypothetical protein Glove_406g22 [Diversispora epigaea]